MKAIAILALVFASVSIFVPVVGVFIAMLCSVLALISFRAQPTLSGIAFGLNIISTAFLSPMIFLADANSTDTAPGDIYLFYVGFHVALLLLAVTWRLIRGAPKEHRSAPDQRIEPRLE
jgi:hypothetical protein